MPNTNTLDSDVLATPKEAERRTVHVPDLRFYVPGDPNKKDEWVIRGHAAVFDKPSLDLGGFTEVIERTAFDEVLADNPHVALVLDHDTRTIMAGTVNGTLELRTDAEGLHFFGRIVPQIAEHLGLLRAQMETGLIGQASFAFSVAEDGDDWDVAEDGVVTRTVKRVGGLYDVTVTSQGAYPQTDSQLLARQLRNRIEAQIKDGRLPQEARASLTAPIEEGEPTPVAPEEGGNSSHTGEETISPRLEEARARANATRLEILRELQEKKLWKKDS